jgi:putative tryptophan/tyrosine transport system substrate-binding protein
MASHIERRKFLATRGGAAAWPLVARAQQAERMRRIGVLMAYAEGDREGQAFIAAFREELKKFGWAEGRNIRIDMRWAAFDAQLMRDEQRLQADAAELVGTAPDVLFAAPTPALAALHHQTRSVPIVFAQVSDPVKLGFVAGLARPGGNITGFATFEHPIGGKWLELLKDTAPGRTRVAVLFDPDNPSQGAYLQAIETAAPTFGVQVTRAGVRNATEIEGTVIAFAQDPNAALIVAPNTVTIPNRDLIIDLAARYRLPAVYPYRFFARSGGFISYGIDLADEYRLAAGYVDRILKGAKPGDLPIQLSSKFELVVNLKAARALGLTISEPLLQAADEVIE